MGRMNTIAQTMQKANKRYTICPSGETNQVGFSFNHQMMLEDILLDGIGYSVHGLFKNKPFHRCLLIPRIIPSPLGIRLRGDKYLQDGQQADAIGAKYEHFYLLVLLQ